MQDEKELDFESYRKIYKNLDDKSSEIKFNQQIHGLMTVIPACVIASMIGANVYQIALIVLAAVFVVNLAASVVEAIKILIFYTSCKVLNEMQVMLALLIAYPNKQQGNEINPFEEVQDTFEWCEKMNK